VSLKLRHLFDIKAGKSLKANYLSSFIGTVPFKDYSNISYNKSVALAKSLEH
jgi:hypothetical protein